MRRENPYRGNHRATLRVVLALALFVLAQTASALHAHAHDSDHDLSDCEICRLSHRDEAGILPALPLLKAPEKVSWKVEAAALEALVIARRFLAFVGRAPPLA